MNNFNFISSVRKSCICTMYCARVWSQMLIYIFHLNNRWKYLRKQRREKKAVAEHSFCTFPEYRFIHLLIFAFVSTFFKGLPLSFRLKYLLRHCQSMWILIFCCCFVLTRKLPTWSCYKFDYMSWKMKILYHPSTYNFNVNVTFFNAISHNAHIVHT